MFSLYNIFRDMVWQINYRASADKQSEQHDGKILTWGAINGDPALVQVTNWHNTDSKPAQ